MTAFTCSRSSPSNHSMISSILAPASRFSKVADTGIRVALRTHAPLTLPGTLSTAGHCDQSRLAMFDVLSFIRCFSTVLVLGARFSFLEGRATRFKVDIRLHVETASANHPTLLI